MFEIPETQCQNTNTYAVNNENHNFTEHCSSIVNKIYKTMCMPIYTNNHMN